MKIIFIIIMILNISYANLIISLGAFNKKINMVYTQKEINKKINIETEIIKVNNKYILFTKCYSNENEIKPLIELLKKNSIDYYLMKNSKCTIDKSNYTKDKFIPIEIKIDDNSNKNILQAINYLENYNKKGIYVLNYLKNHNLLNSKLQLYHSYYLGFFNEIKTFNHYYKNNDSEYIINFINGYSIANFKYEDIKPIIELDSTYISYAIIANRLYLEEFKDIAKQLITTAYTNNSKNDYISLTYLNIMKYNGLISYDEQLKILNRLKSYSKNKEILQWIDINMK